ncbi:hypothetical protein SAMN05660350_03537 [Geodermatophilus obscurus]|uniref:Uncharacterized protein n=1 Tax=Geodermatophilus obscurus TaxID=1861 RepID=A0A1M7UM99_9ACTN|nr:hypothetical protein [Geodermatophilus obscurus]SHN84025.1 hypothetical protein SAMN05660350_03537 [Geodermatophilus obscurus]
MSQAITRRAPVADRSPVRQPAPVAHLPHWTRPDFAGDVLAAAWAPGTAPPREIRVRPELHDRLLAELDPAARAALAEHGVLGEPAGVPVVVDPALPQFPGFEVRRVRPGGPVRARGAA